MKNQTGVPVSGNASPWSPVLGIQTDTINSLADIVLMVGECGTGKTDTLLALSILHQHRSLIVMREYDMLESIRIRAIDLLVDKATFNSYLDIWRLDDSRIIEFAAVPKKSDAYSFTGRRHDGVFLDNLQDFKESQFWALFDIADTYIKDQRVRTVCTTRPSLATPWMIKFWHPWLHPSHHSLAKSGELRWFISEGDKIIDCPNNKPIPRLNKRTGRSEWITPMSRTLISAHD